MENSDPPLPCSSLAASSWPNMKFKTAYCPGDDTELSLEKIHKRVAKYLSPAEKKEFQNMTPNKIAVVGLFHEVLTDYLPGIDSTTYRLFGYSKLHELDHVALTGLYQGLIKILGCKVDEFLGAYQRGQLASLIEFKFSQLPQGSRGSYYGWFLERRDLFDALKPSQDESASPRPDHHSDEDEDENEAEAEAEINQKGFKWRMANYLVRHSLGVGRYPPFPDRRSSTSAAKIRPEKLHRRLVEHLSPDEKEEFKNMTQNKMAVVSLFYDVLKIYLPALDSATYCLFGYSKLQEMDQPNLMGLYEDLIVVKFCKVHEFVEAYENGHLVSLIESKLSDLRGGFYRWFDRNRDLFNGLKPSSVLHMGSDENESKAQKCCVCNAFASTCCGGCRRVWYCSKEHQKEDWKDHKGICSHHSNPSVREGGNCGVCNTFASTCCGRCRKVWYCSTEHQSFDWKDHKGVCGPDFKPSSINHGRSAKKEPEINK